MISKVPNKSRNTNGKKMRHGLAKNVKCANQKENRQNCKNNRKKRKIIPNTKKTVQPI